jgi:hypothetical protein
MIGYNYRTNWHDYSAQRVADRTINLIILQRYVTIRGRDDLTLSDMVVIIREHTELLVRRFVDRPGRQQEYYPVAGLRGYYIIRHQIFIPDDLLVAIFLLERDDDEVVAELPMDGSVDLYRNFITIDITNEYDE